LISVALTAEEGSDRLAAAGFLVKNASSMTDSKKDAVAIALIELSSGDPDDTITSEAADMLVANIGDSSQDPSMRHQMMLVSIEYGEFIQDSSIQGDIMGAVSDFMMDRTQSVAKGESQVSAQDIGLALAVFERTVFMSSDENPSGSMMLGAASSILLADGTEVSITALVSGAGKVFAQEGAVNAKGAVAYAVLSNLDVFVKAGDPAEFSTVTGPLIVSAARFAAENGVMKLSDAVKPEDAGILIELAGGELMAIMADADAEDHTKIDVAGFIALNSEGASSDMVAAATSTLSGMVISDSEGYSEDALGFLAQAAGSGDSRMRNSAALALGAVIASGDTSSENKVAAFKAFVANSAALTGDTKLKVTQSVQLALSEGSTQDKLALAPEVFKVAAAGARSKAKDMMKQSAEDSLVSVASDTDASSENRLAAVMFLGANAANMSDSGKRATASMLFDLASGDADDEVTVKARSVAISAITGKKVDAGLRHQITLAAIDAVASIEDASVRGAVMGAVSSALGERAKDIAAGKSDLTQEDVVAAMAVFASDAFMTDSANIEGLEAVTAAAGILLADGSELSMMTLASGMDNAVASENTQVGSSVAEAILTNVDVFIQLSDPAEMQTITAPIVASAVRFVADNPEMNLSDIVKPEGVAIVMDLAAGELAAIAADPEQPESSRLDVCAFIAANSEHAEDETIAAAGSALSEIAISGSVEGAKEAMASIAKAISSTDSRMRDSAGIAVSDIIASKATSADIKVSAFKFFVKKSAAFTNDTRL
ncbi:hypothetical protein ACFL42_05220, partial [Candidatus Omnitrophota bacterium]